MKNIGDGLQRGWNAFSSERKAREELEKKLAKQTAYAELKGEKEVRDEFETAARFILKPRDEQIRRLFESAFALGADATKGREKAEGKLALVTGRLAEIEVLLGQPGVDRLPRGDQGKKGRGGETAEAV